MSLTPYFQAIHKRVENSEIDNGGKDKNGFYMPTRTLLLRHLQLLVDLNEKPAAKPMLAKSWEFVVDNLPPEWLILNANEKAALKAMLKLD